MHDCSKDVREAVKILIQARKRLQIKPRKLRSLLEVIVVVALASAGILNLNIRKIAQRGEQQIESVFVDLSHCGIPVLCDVRIIGSVEAQYDVSVSCSQLTPQLVNCIDTRLQESLVERCNISLPNARAYTRDLVGTMLLKQEETG